MSRRDAIRDALFANWKTGSTFPSVIEAGVAADVAEQAVVEWEAAQSRSCPYCGIIYANTRSGDGTHRCRGRARGEHQDG